MGIVKSATGSYTLGFLLLAAVACVALGILIRLTPSAIAVVAEPRLSAQ